jgi:T5SS/PEP-CTERM-associated repeat protein
MREKNLSVARICSEATWFCRVVAGFLLFILVQQMSQAEIILPRGGAIGQLFVSGRARAGPPSVNPPPERDDYNPPPQLFGPTLSLPATSLSGSGEVPGAKASSDTRVSFNINLNTTADTLSVNASGSSKLIATRDPPTPTRASHSTAVGNSRFDFTFELTDRPYDYTLSGQASATASQTQTGSRGDALVELSGATEFTEFYIVDHDVVQGVTTTGSPTGVLPPGEYRLLGSAQGSYDLGTADFLYNIQLTLTPINVVRWENPVSGVFQTAGNWDTGAPPSGGDFGLIDVPGTYTVSLAANAAHRRLQATGAGTRVTLDLDGHRYEADELVLGDPSGNFSFTLSDSSGIVAAPPDDDGPWPAPGVGRARFARITANQPGSGEVTARVDNHPQAVIDAGFVMHVHGDGEWRVVDLTVGDGRGGALLISSGGEVNTATSIIGKHARGLAGKGKAVVSGGGGQTSLFDAHTMIVGDNGQGELEIKNGGEVGTHLGGLFVVGNTPNGEGVVTVDGATAKLRQTGGFLVIGREGKGTLNVLNDAVVVAEDKFLIGETSSLPASPNSQGVVNVRRGQIDVTTGSMTVGARGEGTLNVLDASLVRTGNMRIGTKGKVTVDNSRLGVDGTLNVNGELRINTTGTGRVGPPLINAPSGKLTIGPGGTLMGTGKIFAKLNLAGGTNDFPLASIFAPGNSAGTLTVEGDVEQEAGSAMEIEIGGTAAGQFDVLAVTGNATLGGDVFLKFIDGFSPRQGQQFEFLDVSGTLSGSFANVHLRNLAPGFEFDLSRADGGMTMVALNDGVFVLPPSSAWNVDASGLWASVANWTDSDPNHAGGTAVFSAKITAPRTVTVDEPITVGRIDFDNTNAYTIAGEGTLTLDATSGAAQINVTSGSHTISAPVSLADNTVITVSPADSNLSLTGALSAGGLNVTKAGAGRLTLANLQASGLTIDQGTVAMGPTGTGASTSVLGALSIAGGTAPAAQLDLTDNAAIIDYTGPSPVATIRQQILAGRGGPGLGKTWNGQGITSSAAAMAEIETRAVGFAENSAMPLGPFTTFRGQPVDDTSILIVFTRTGDANLDGVVNDNDVTIVGATYAPGVAQASWALGDFDYNGFVDDNDVTLLGAFYDPAAVALVSGGVVSGEGVAAVPEPSTALLLSSVLMGILLGALNRKRKGYGV